MAYRPDWWPEDYRGTGTAELFGMIDSLHGHNTGSSDPLPLKTKRLYKRCLRWVLDNWTESARSYDHAVRYLVSVTLEETE